MALALRGNRCQTLPLLNRPLLNLFLHIVHGRLDLWHHVLDQTGPLPDVRNLGQQVLQNIDLVLNLREGLHVLAHTAQVDGVN